VALSSHLVGLGSCGIFSKASLGPEPPSSFDCCVNSSRAYGAGDGENRVCHHRALSCSHLVPWPMSRMRVLIDIKETWLLEFNRRQREGRLRNCRNQETLGFSSDAT
jgi:hypothetical protein